MELVIVVVIIGVIAGFAIPSYEKAMEKGREKTAIVKLEGIAGGIKIYKAKHGSYPAFDMPNVTSINQNLQLNVPADTMTYRCLQVDGALANVCSAISPDGWSIHWHELGSGGNTIHCADGGPACPSCPFWASGSCG